LHSKVTGSIESLQTSFEVAYFTTEGATNWRIAATESGRTATGAAAHTDDGRLVSSTAADKARVISQLFQTERSCSLTADSIHSKYPGSTGSVAVPMAADAAVMALSVADKFAIVLTAVHQSYRLASAGIGLTAVRIFGPVGAAKGA
jgi:hypothetical protein